MAAPAPGSPLDSAGIGENLHVSGDPRLTLVEKLRKFGIDTSVDHVYTSALATAEFVRTQRPNGTAYVIGEGGLLNALNDVNYAISRESPDYVIVGEGRDRPRGVGAQGRRGRE